MKLRKKLIEKSLVVDSGIRGWISTPEISQIKTVPQQFLRKSFVTGEMEDIDEFEEMDDLEKWEMAYWVEKNQTDRVSKYGIITGFLVATFFGWIAILISDYLNYGPISGYLVVLGIVGTLMYIRVIKR